MIKKPLGKLVLFILLELAVVLFIVWVFDPFYQYHAPFGEPVLNDRDNQMPGTVRNFEYDSVLVGSSTSENCDTGVLDAALGLQTLKIIRAGGSVADQVYYLNMAHRKHSLKTVFWGLDVFAFTSSPESTITKESAPYYLHTESLLDDIPYLLNKEILLQTIPKNIAFGLQGINVGGDAYNWSRGKEYGASVMMRAYEKPANDAPSVDYSGDAEVIAKNIELLICELEAHPETQYTFFLLPYSQAWWDCAYANGEVEKDFYILRSLMETLLRYPNAKLYFFMDREEILDLDNYMDLIHFRPELNNIVLEEIIRGNGLVTPDNYEAVLAGMRELTERIHAEEIYRYYDRP